MAKVKKEKEAGKEAKNPVPKGFKPRAKMSDEERLAKKKARMEAIKNRPHVQRSWHHRFPSWRSHRWRMP